MITTAHPVIHTDADYFESVYAEAQGDAARIPWADGHANPAMVTWLNAIAPSLLRCGSRTCVVGCGLGDDARELIRRGYEVTAFDCSPTAIQWCKRLDQGNAGCYQVVDLFDLPARWKHRFDLVIEANTLQSLSPEMQEDALRRVTDLVSMRGYLVVIARHAEDESLVEDGPPWPLHRQSLEEMARRAGLKMSSPIAVFEDDEDPPVTRMRAVFNRA
jgi:2-polyprenyl-3-methyl-5-hydroxy-6-metoxy-1,4-benzoquinol methylase